MRRQGSSGKANTGSSGLAEGEIQMVLGVRKSQNKSTQIRRNLEKTNKIFTATADFAERAEVMKSKQQQLIKVVKEKEEKLGRSPHFELRTKNSHPLDEVVSGLQKAIRRGLENRALYFMCEMVEGGFAGYFWRRIGIISIEDIGLADPLAPVVVNSLAQLHEKANRQDRDFLSSKYELYYIQATAKLAVQMI